MLFLRADLNSKADNAVAPLFLARHSFRCLGTLGLCHPSILKMSRIGYKSKNGKPRRVGVDQRDVILGINLVEFYGAPQPRI